MPPLRPGLLALLLLVPAGTRAQPAPVAASAPAAAANLQRHPELASDFDRVLLLDAGYLLERDGGVFSPEHAPLDEPALKAALEKLRSERKEKTLADLESLQENFGKNGKLTPDQLEKLQKDLQSGWPLIPDDVRAGFNEMLSNAGSSPVSGPKLDWVERVAKSWGKDDPGDDPSVTARPRLGLPPMPFPGTDMPMMKGGYSHHDEFSPPSPAVVKARLAEVDRATYRDPETGRLQPYAPDVKEALRVVMQYADSRDGEAALRVLREGHPPIAIGNGTVPPFAGGVSYSPDGENPNDIPRIGLDQSLIGYGYDKKTQRFTILPSGDPAYYKKLGLPPPNEAALNPASKPVKTEKYAYYTQEVFADGSVRQTPTALGLAPTLLHELMHQNTYLIGAGENAFSNEMRSMTAERRLMYNRDEARGLTRSPDYGKNWDWYSRPLDFRRSILASYSSKEIGEVRPGEETVDGQIEAKRRLLASGDLTAWRTDAVNSGVDRQRENDLSVVDALEKGGLVGKVEAEQARERIAAAAEALRRKRQADPVDAAALLKGDMARLQTDREQTLRVFLEDWRWHQERGIGSYEEKPDVKH